MAKKKSKKNNDIAKYTVFASVLLGIVAVVMMFLPAIAIKDSETSYTGLQLAFGYSKTVEGWGDSIITTAYAGFSFMNLLTYILAIVGIVFTVLGAMGKGGKFATFISAVAFIASGVFFFLQGSFCVPLEGMEGLVGLLGGNIKDYFVIGAGAIIGGITSILAGICALAKIVLSK